MSAREICRVSSVLQRDSVSGTEARILILRRGHTLHLKSSAQQEKAVGNECAGQNHESDNSARCRRAREGRYAG